MLLTVGFTENRKRKHEDHQVGVFLQKFINVEQDQGV